MKNLFIFLMILPYHGSHGVEKSVSVNEGDSVTLHTEVKTNQQEEIAWYFNNSRIARIIGDLSFICTDVQCKHGNDRYRDRLTLDHQTGSLTIMNITNTDSGDYRLAIISSGSEKIFSVAVNGVPAAQRDEKKTKSVVEGESVTLHPGVTKTPNVVMTWYCDETLITEITGDQSKICSDVQCKERFRDRLKLDHQTGSLTITNTRNTDSGYYKLEISSSSSSVVVTSLKSFSISITVSGLSAGKKVGICVFAVLLIIAASVCGFYFYKHRVKRKDTRTQHNDQADGVNDLSDQNDVPLLDDAHERSINHTDAPVKDTTNDSSSYHTDSPVMDTTNDSSSYHTDAPVMDTTNDSSSNHTDPLVRNTTNDSSSNHTDPLVRNTTNDSSSNHTDAPVMDTTNDLSSKHSEIEPAAGSET